MKKYFLKIFLSGLLFLILLISGMLFTSYLVKKRHFRNWETRSSTLFMGKGRQYDLLITGTSHARVFSRYKNHLRIEKILNMSIINIGKGGATSGVNEQFFFLKYFYSQNNSTNKILYFLSTPLLYSEILPVTSNTFNEEPFSFKFFFEYLKFKSENKGLRLLEYCRSKLKLDWITLKPQSGDALLDSLNHIDSTALQMTVKKFYDTNNIERFNKSCNTIEEEIRFAQAHHAEIIFILPPALFGKWMGQERTLEFAERMKKRYGIKYYDFSEAVLIPQYYYDHQHLNSLGIIYFTEKFLKPVLTNDSSFKYANLNEIQTRMMIRKECMELIKED